MGRADKGVVWAGGGCAALGVLLAFLGWFGVSGETDAGLQLPYLASASLPGCALIVAGAVLLAGERTRRASERTDARVTALYDLLTMALQTDEPAGLVTVAGTTRYHRRGCALVEGKPGVTTVDAATAAGLQPCPVCRPDPPDA